MTLAQQLAASLEIVRALKQQKDKENMANPEMKELKTRKASERPDVNAWLNATDEQRASMKSINDQFDKLPRALQVIVRSQIHKAMEAKS